MAAAMSSQSEYEVVSSASRIYDDVLFVVRAEMKRYKAVVRKGKALSVRDSMMIRNYVLTVVNVERERRSKEHFDKVNAMTRDELRAAAASLIANDPDLRVLVEKFVPKPVNNTDDSEVYVE